MMPAQNKIFSKAAKGCVLTIGLMLLTGCYGRYNYRNDPWVRTGAPEYYNDFDNDFYDNDDIDNARDSLPNKNDQSPQSVIENSLPNQNNQPLRRVY